MAQERGLRSRISARLDRRLARWRDRLGGKRLKHLKHLFDGIDHRRCRSEDRGYARTLQRLMVSSRNDASAHQEDLPFGGPQGLRKGRD